MGGHAHLHVIRWCGWTSASAAASPPPACRSPGFPGTSLAQVPTEHRSHVLPSQQPLETFNWKPQHDNVAALIPCPGQQAALGGPPHMHGQWARAQAAHPTHVCHEWVLGTVPEHTGLRTRSALARLLPTVERGHPTGKASMEMRRGPDKTNSRVSDQETHPGLSFPTNLKLKSVKVKRKLMILKQKSHSDLLFD